MTEFNDTNTLGSVTRLHSHHDGDYEHNFSLANSIESEWANEPSQNTERLIYEIAKKLIEPVKQELYAVKEECTNIREENKILKERLINLESLSKRSNLKFIGLREQRGETKLDCKRLILSLLQSSGIQLHPKGIESATRTGSHTRYYERPVVVKFFHNEEKDMVYAKSGQIYRITGIKIEEDFPQETEKNRRLLKPILAKANNTASNGKRKYQASLHQDKLIVNGRTYSVDTIKHLPDDIHPTTVYTPTRNGITAFFGGLSPLSNHHISPQKMNNIQFNCNEQFYMYEKAKVFNDSETAAQILKEKDPVLQKKLGSNIAKFDRKVWKTKCLDIMERGLKAKFDQNPVIKNFLINTNATMLLEANPKDPYWGIGLSTYDRRTWTKNSWVGKATNHMGRLLSELRTIYNRQ